MVRIHDKDELGTSILLDGPRTTRSNETAADNGGAERFLGDGVKGSAPFEGEEVKTERTQAIKVASKEGFGIEEKMPCHHPPKIFKV